ncbi:cobalt ECF transporter T component CbiQ [Pseudodesulfovibrio sp.]|uniref:cobalt ECF transporter T component CbiQ n=1 Tax=Pseudodesulfovibrio sp. TaxID=2035812 RepID=UPI00263A1033|nr:cobalt ECF transporter T component CbiQ [Pseudodesulfovibrio sp.]MDD3310876.1 cobalt ECF transporter T component CbiQ [Pseudodesulfovibrio sp.]
MTAIAAPFAEGRSLLHRLDPRFRLLAAAALTLPAAVLHDLRAALAALAAGALLVLLARLSPVRVAGRVLAVNAFILFLWLFIPFSLDGAPLLVLGPFTATREGVDLALLLTVKSNAILLTLMALLGTIPVQDLGPAMQRLGVPGKLCHILLFTYRYIFVIHQEYLTMRQAMQARGFRPRTDRHTYRSYAWLLGMLLVRSWDRAERVHGAMRCRGFQGRFYTLTSFAAAPGDYAFLAGSLIVTAAIICLEIMRIS